MQIPFHGFQLLQVRPCFGPAFLYPPQPSFYLAPISKLSGPNQSSQRTQIFRQSPQLALPHGLFLLRSLHTAGQYKHFSFRFDQLDLDSRPITDLPGITSTTRTLMVDSERARSFESPLTLLTFRPGAS